MKPNDITCAYFIFDSFDESIFIKNGAKNKNNTVIVCPINYELIFENKYRRINIESLSLLESIDQVFKNISTDWLIILKPEEAFITGLDHQYLEHGAYNICVEKFISKNKVNNLVYGDLKLYHRNHKDNKKINFFNLIVHNYSYFFPEIEHNKLKSVVTEYKNGNSNLKNTLYLLDKKLISLDNDYLISTYYNELDDSPDALELLRYVTRILIVNKELEKAKDIIFKAFLNFPNSPCMNSLMSEVNFMQGNYREAKFFISKCIEMGIDNSLYMYLPFSSAIVNYAAHYFLGKINYQMGNLIEAKTSYKDCLDIKPDFKPADIEYKKVIEELEESKSYVNDLDFACQGCGNCCRDFEKVTINHHDLIRILNNRPDLELNDFVESSYNKEFNMPSLNLKKKSDSRDCIFLENNLCTINDFKPLGCKVWPFVVKGDSIVTWSANNRSFIKNRCSFKLIEGSNNKDELEKNIRINDFQNKQLKNLFDEWDKEINISDNELNPNFLEYLKNNLSEIN